MNPKIRAETLIEELNIQKVEEIDVTLISYYLGIDVCKKKIDGSAARLTCLGKSAIISVSNAEKYEPRIRFSIAHEIGHFLLHQDRKFVFSCSAQDMLEWNKYDKEVEANTFSANLLIPALLFLPYIRGKFPSLNLIRNISNDFSSSYTASILRYFESTKEPCAIICSCDGRILWSKRNKDFPYYLIGNGSLLEEHSYAADAFSKRISALEGEVPCYAWITDKRVNPDMSIFESTFYIPSLSRTYSLLWVNEDIEH
jgi:hypothetical protein